jgi:hypothetical protein
MLSLAVAAVGLPSKKKDLAGRDHRGAVEQFDLPASRRGRIRVGEFDAEGMGTAQRIDDAHPAHGLLGEGAGNIAVEFDVRGGFPRIGAQPGKADLGQLAVSGTAHDFGVVRLVDEHAVPVEFELAGPRVGDFSFRVPQDEQPLAVDRHVQRIVGLPDLALLEGQHRRPRIQAVAQAAVTAHSAVAGQIAAGIEKIGELQAGTLEARGVEVGRVVRDHPQTF